MLWGAPLIQERMLTLACIDLKGAVEANMIPESLRGGGTAGTADEAIDLLTELSAEVDRRTAYMRAHMLRKLPTSVEWPKILLYCDEMNDMMRQGAKSKKLKELMEHLLSQGAAENLTVLGLAQDATKEQFPWRPLFQQRIAMRMEKGMAMLALGDLAKSWRAKPWRISPSCPGEGYMLDYEERRSVHFQAYEVTDDDLMNLERFAPTDA